MFRPVQADIDLLALKHNFQMVKSYAKKSAVMAVVKANAYGHGSIAVAKTLKDADAFAVASTDEAVLLRTAGIVQPIVLLEGFLTEDELAVIWQYKLTVVLHSFYQIILLSEAIKKNPHWIISVWLKIDTGMHRLGILPEQVMLAWDSLKVLQNIQIMGLMSHFSCAEEQQDKYNQQQLNILQGFLSMTTKRYSIANSAAIIHFSKSHGDWVRPGIMLYGVNPIANKWVDLQPVMTLKSKLIAIKTLLPGEAIGYGASWISPEKMLIGIVAIGYADGYPRHIRENTPVLIGNKKVPIIGRVSMDMMMLDLRQAEDVHIGDTVTLWGKGLAIEYIAECAGTIAYELLSQVTPRVKMNYIN